MPEPKSKFATDKFVYYIAKKLSPHLYNINPNLISVAGLLLIIPILNNLYNGGSIAYLIMLVITKQFLDCLDGTVAREHNKTSIVGILVDTLCDLITIFLYLRYCIYQFNKNKQINCLFALIICLITYGLIDEFSDLYRVVGCYIKKKNIKCAIKQNYNILNRFVHDNSVLIQLISVLIFKLNSD